MHTKCTYVLARPDRTISQTASSTSSLDIRATSRATAARKIRKLISVDFSLNGEKRTTNRGAHITLFPPLRETRHIASKRPKFPILIVKTESLKTFIIFSFGLFPFFLLAFKILDPCCANKFKIGVHPHSLAMVLSLITALRVAYEDVVVIAIIFLNLKRILLVQKRKKKKPT